MSTSTVVNVNDPRVQYSGDWSNGESNLHTTEYAAEVRFTFIGTSVSVYGMIYETAGTPLPMSNFTIDDMPPVTFTEPAEGSTVDNVRFYLSPVLPNGEHTLTVTNANTGMLWIDYFKLFTLISSITTSETTTIPPSTTSTMGSTSAPPPSETVPGVTMITTSTTLPFTPSTSVFVVSSNAVPIPASFIASVSSSQESSSTTSLSTSASETPSTSTLSSITSLASASSSSSRHTSSPLAKSTGISTSANSDTGGSSGGLSTGAFAAIAAASAFVAAIAAAGLILLCRNRQKRRRALEPNIIFPTDAHFSNFMWSRDPSLPVVYEDDLAPSEGDYRQVELHGSRPKEGIPSRDDDVYSEHTSWIGSHYPASEYQAVPR